MRDEVFRGLVWDDGALFRVKCGVEDLLEKRVSDLSSVFGWTYADNLREERSAEGRSALASLRFFRHSLVGISQIVLHAVDFAAARETQERRGLDIEIDYLIDCFREPSGCLLCQATPSRGIKPACFLDAFIVHKGPS